MKKGFRNVNLVLQDGVRKGCLSFEGDRILSFDEPEEALFDGEQVYV